MVVMAGFDEMVITLSDGYQAYARYWSAGLPRGAVLYVHGIQSHSGWYEASAARLSAAGFVTLQFDRRGSGRNTQARGHAESALQLLDDAFCCLDVLCERSGFDKCHLLGVSWGGKLVASMHAARPERTASLLLVTPGLFPVIGVSKSEMFRIGISMVGSPERLHNIPLNDPELFTTLADRIEFLRRDELQLHQATAAFFLASRRMDKEWCRLKESPPVPLHLFLAADERIIDNEKTRAFVLGLPWPHCTITTYENSRHTLEFDPDRHHYLDDLVERLTDGSS